MSENTESIREQAREQLKTEQQATSLTDVVSDLSEDLLQAAKNASRTKEKRQALAEVRKAKKMLDEESDKIQKLSEFSADELFDEVVRVVRQREAQRNAGEDQPPAGGREDIREDASEGNKKETD